MEISWKWLNLCLGLLFLQLCNGLPLNLEDTVSDEHTQFLTGLVAVLLTVCSVVLLAGCLCCQRRNGFKEKEKEFRDNPVTASAASNLDHGHVNPIANGEFTIFTPLSPPHYNNNVFLANEQVIIRTPEDYVYGDIDVSSWFNGPGKDFPRVKLKYIRELGKGWFGKVVEGAAQDINPDQPWSTVVVRILDAAATGKERLLFLHDAEIYRHGVHPNILGFVGRCLDTVPLLLLQEHCSQGDLKGYLLANQKNVEKLLSTEYPLMWCCQLTSALKHLHDNNIVHPDLATRNCQLTNGLVLKLGDYGLAASKYPQDYYTGSPSVPVRWSAPESLHCTSTIIQPKKMTVEANVWSLGVTMWEIYECGQQPYDWLNDDEVVSQVFGTAKLRLQRPSHQVLYTDYIFRLMQLCWTNAESRPAVSQINLMLMDLMQVHKNRNTAEKMSVDDFDKRWESFKPNALVKTDNCTADTVSIDIVEEGDSNFSKPLSPSLNNLHGSLDDLREVVSHPLADTLDIESTKDQFLSLEDEFSLTPNFSSMAPLSESKIQFKLGPSVPTSNQKSQDLFNQNDSLTDSIIFVQRTSSESETEEENWKTKVERGAYTEKVRLKSRSVADLMILTHVDNSESESETPLHSLDDKHVRYTPKNNLESLSVTFSSEGNLLNVEDTFQEELRKLQVERRDSLLFVPDNNSQSIVVQTNSDPSLVSPSKRLMHELNSPSEIEPVNQVYNVFNVTIDKYCPLDVNSAKLSEIINLKCNDCTNIEDLNFTRQDSENKSDLGYNTLHNSERNSEFGGSVDENISEEFYSKEERSDDLEKARLGQEDNDQHCAEFEEESVLTNETDNQEEPIVNLENLAKEVELENEEIESSDIDCSEKHLEDSYTDQKSPVGSPIYNLNSENDDLDYVTRLGKKIDTTNIDTDLAANIVDEIIEHLKDNREKLTKENKGLEIHSLKRESIIPNKFKGMKIEEISEEVIEHLPGIKECEENECDDLKEKQKFDESSFCILENDNNIQENDNFIDETNKLSVEESVLDKKDLVSDLSEIKPESIEKESDEENIVPVPNIKEVINASVVSDVKGNNITNVVEEQTEPCLNVDQDLLVNDFYKSTDKLQHHLDDLKQELINSFVIPIIEEAEKSVNKQDDIAMNKTDDEKLEILSQNVNVSYEVPRLSDIIQNNDDLMEYIVTNYDDANNTNVISESENQKPFTESDGTSSDSNNEEHSLEPKDNLTFQNTPNNQTVLLESDKDKWKTEELQHYEGVSENVVDTTPSNQKAEEPQNSEGVSENIFDTTPSNRKEDIDNNSVQPRVQFDVSDHQDEAMPNSLTHSTVFTSTPFGRKQELSMPSHDTFSSLNLFDAKPEETEEELLRFSSNFAPLDKSSEEKDLKYSLETWDNFLGKTLDHQQPENEDLFDSFSSEPQSLLFLENDNDVVVNEVQEGTFVLDKNTDPNKTQVIANKENPESTFTVEDQKNGTFVVDDKQNGTFVIENDKSVAGSSNAAQALEEVAGTWETGGGWFLHPQSSNDSLSGDMQMPSTSRTDSYVGFGMDDEIMAAIRNELLQKLPHAQGASNDKVKEEEEEWESGERNEVFLRYNVYNTPLSPIPEESLIEEDEDYSSGEDTPKKHEDDIDSDWSDQVEPENLPQDTVSRTNEVSVREPTHRHTPSQDSCCSNDTLFNLEELICAEKDTDVKPQDESSPTNKYTNDVFDSMTHSIDDDNTIKPEIVTDLDATIVIEHPHKVPDINGHQINEFLSAERKHTGDDMGYKHTQKPADEILLVPFPNRQVAPLPSPEDNPWRQLPASLLSYEKVTQNSLLPEDETVPESSESQDSTFTTAEEDRSPIEQETESNQVFDTDMEQFAEDLQSKCDTSAVAYENTKSENVIDFSNTEENNKPVYENIIDDSKPYVNVEIEPKGVDYENVDNCVDDIFNEADYVNIVNMENSKNSADFSKEQQDEDLEYLDEYVGDDNLIIKNGGEDDENDFFGVLTDIRFSGPSDNQMMSTSFSESNDNDEQDWDSGSDTRSTSSGEFIWKEGEHEESLKALRAAPQDVFEDVKPMEEIAEETTSESEASTSSDEDGETPEFVPSAWDKFATPTKSALRSPEKSLERSERRKSKGVWFKKQKYHCVYEYPREPESPILQSQDLWKPETDYTAFTDWEFDAETYLPPPTDDSDIFPSTFTFKPKCKTARNSLYQLTSITDFPQTSNSTTDDEFFISSSARPFDLSSLSSQFFPGSSNWIENATPDSGVEDTTPGSVTDPSEYTNVLANTIYSVQSLKHLATEAVNRGKAKTSEVMGGMRHTRNKLKLDLPPSPSAFTTSKTFTVEAPQEPIVIREKPTFSTFGKSRFLVQHVETPPADDTSMKKNVSFEALPYKPFGDKENNANSCNNILYEPLEKHDENELAGKTKVEIVRGEASLLDSADEDSGIESSTLERKLSSVAE